MAYTTAHIKRTQRKLDNAISQLQKDSFAFFDEFNDILDKIRARKEITSYQRAKLVSRITYVLNAYDKHLEEYNSTFLDFSNDLPF